MNFNNFPCPICRKICFIIGTNDKDEKLTNCGHAYSFTRTKSQKMMDRKYIRTAWGLELAEGR